MAKSILYDCYAYLVVDHVTNFHPFRNPKDNIHSIISLKEGDIIYIKGLGRLMVTSKFIDNHDYIVDGKNGLYQEISIKCITIN